MVLVENSRLHGREAHKVVVLVDSVRSHTAKMIANWMDHNSIKHISKEEWSPYSPDISSLDLLKSATGK
jgi:hypothetical protein